MSKVSEKERKREEGRKSRVIEMGNDCSGRG